MRHLGTADLCGYQTMTKGNSKRDTHLLYHCCCGHFNRFIILPNPETSPNLDERLLIRQGVFKSKTRPGPVSLRLVLTLIKPPLHRTINLFSCITKSFTFFFYVSQSLSHTVIAQRNTSRQSAPLIKSRL